MITRLPDQTHFDAMTLTATVGHPVQRQVFCVVMRAGYDLRDTGSGPRSPELSDDPDLTALTLAGGTAPGAPDPDLTPQKERIDIIVRGHVNPGAGVNSGLVLIDQTQMRRRDDPASDDDSGTEVPTDLDQHLFGVHGMGEGGRVPASSIVRDVAQYHPRVHNSYRRSAGFTAPPVSAALTPGAEVEIFQNTSQSGAPYRLRLPADAFSAQLRLATGHCPDKPNRWAIFGAQDLVADTLVVTPAANTAHLVWRASWDTNSFDMAALRAVQIDRKES